MSDPTRPNRRQVLGSLGALASASSLTGCGAPALEAEPPAPGTAAELIDTFVVLMMENRSFDNYFGALSLEEDRADVDGLTAEMSNPDATGAEIEPFRILDSCLEEDPPHGWDSSRRQFADGTCRGFVTTHARGEGPVAHDAIGYHNRDDLQVYYALLEGGALCQRWFSSVMGSTWPNRFYSYCGTCLGMKSNDFNRVPFPARSIFDQLEDAGVSYGIFTHGVAFAGLLEGMGALIDGVRIFHIDDFFAQAEAGQLPEVCFIEPGYTFNDDHPPHAVELGQVLVGSVYEALARGPHWERCLLVVDYDEHGGFFDHVPPPLAADDLADEGFDQLGFRVPALVLGPYAKVGVVDTVFDHTSVLKHIQDRFGLDALSARNAAAHDLSSCLDTTRLQARDPAPPVRLPTLDITVADVDTACLAYGQSEGQPELIAALQSGRMPAPVDYRDRMDDTIRNAWARAVKWGLVKG